MTYLQSFNLRTRRPMALALAVTVGGLAGLLAGQARAADVPQTYSPAPAPYVEERVQTSFSRFGPYVGVRWRGLGQPQASTPAAGWSTTPMKTGT